MHRPGGSLTAETDFLPRRPDIFFPYLPPFFNGLPPKVSAKVFSFLFNAFERSEIPTVRTIIILFYKRTNERELIIKKLGTHLNVVLSC